MDTGNMFCPFCHQETIVLLATTAEQKWYCTSCDRRYSTDEERDIISRNIVNVGGPHQTR